AHHQRTAEREEPRQQRLARRVRADIERYGLARVFHGAGFALLSPAVSSRAKAAVEQDRAGPARAADQRWLISFTASSRPGPHGLARVQPPCGAGTALAFTFCSIRSGLPRHDGFFESASAIAPETWGAAIDVPW